jgi:serine/threonine protein kinase
MALALTPRDFPVLQKSRGADQGGVQDLTLRAVHSVATGSTASVYEAIWANKRVAVKMLSKRAASDASLQRDFQHDLQSVRRVQHPNIVRVYAIGQEPLPFMLMERLEETLHARIKYVYGMCAYVSYSAILCVAGVS